MPKRVRTVLHRRQHPSPMEAHRDRLWVRPRSAWKAGGWNGAEHSFRRCSSSPVRTRSLVSVTVFIFVEGHASFHADATSLISPRASMFFGASQHLRGKRTKSLGWEPRLVVFEEWSDETSLCVGQVCTVTELTSLSE